MSKVIRICFGFASTTLPIGFKNSRHFFIQSEVKPKPIMIPASAKCIFLVFWLVHCIVGVFCDWLEWLLWFWSHDPQAPSTLCGRNLKTKVSLWKRIKGFPSTLRRKNLTVLQSPVILDLCLRKTLLGKSHDYRNAIVLENLCFHNVFRPYQNEKPAFWNSFGLKRVFEKLRFRDGLVWTVGLTVEINAFSSFSVSIICLSVSLLSIIAFSFFLSTL